MNTPWSNHITRDTGPLNLEGIRATTLKSLLDMLADSGAVAPWIIADLSLGAWRSHQVASEFCRQLRLPSPRPRQQASEDASIQGSPPSYADSIGRFIDAEGLGDTTTLSALDLAGYIAASLGAIPRGTFLVITPRYGLPWEPENILFIRFFAQALRAGGLPFLLICTDHDASAIPDDWMVTWRNAPEPNRPPMRKALVGLVPGVIEPEVRIALEAHDQDCCAGMLPLENGSLLIPPEYRRRPGDISRLEFDQLAVASRPIGWLVAYALFFGNNFHVDSWLLCSEAWRRLGEGGHGIALRLAERAIECSRAPVQKGVVQSLAQGIRIASQRFSEAAEAPDPSPAIPQELQRFLLLAKGWGLVMCEEPERAERYLQGARELLGPICPDDHENLYLLNISALNRLKLSDVEGALATEKEIEASCARLARRDWRLEYVNTINIARLLRRQRDYGEAEFYYAQAFATVMGARSEGDAIYSNVCLGRLNAERGRRQEAFENWLRACLHWVSCSAPEALGNRVASAILGRNLSQSKSNPEEISAALTSLLLESARASRLDPIIAIAMDSDFYAKAAPVFIRGDPMLEAAAPGTIRCAALAPGCSILAASIAAKPRIDGPNYLRLQWLLFEWLKLMCPFDDIRDSQTIIVDDCLGHEMPFTIRGLLETCVRLRIPRMLIGSNAVTMDSDLRDRLEKRLRVRHGSAVDRIKFDGPEAIVSFKRYLAPTALFADESLILTMLDDHPSVEELKERAPSLDTPEPAGRMEGMLRSLERARVVNLYLPDTLCLSAGIGLL